MGRAPPIRRACVGPRPHCKVATLQIVWQPWAVKPKEATLA
jgi:hypothetical protein